MLSLFYDNKIMDLLFALQLVTIDKDNFRGANNDDGNGTLSCLGEIRSVSVI